MKQVHVCKQLVIFAMVMVLNACAAKAADSTSTQQAIINGTLAPDDSATVLVVIQKLPDQEFVCTGTVVAPHVVLTAAHCLDERVVGEGFSHYVFTGDDINDAAQADDRKRWVNVKALHFDPAYDPAILTGEHDVGLIVTKSKLAATPLPMLRRALGADDRGKPVRVLGYGRTDPQDNFSTGTRYQLPSTIVDITAGEILRSNDTTSETCEGDSGGATLLVEGDHEVIAGIHSWGEHATSCTGPDHDARIDTHWDFLTPLIEAADPGFLPPAPPPDMTPPSDLTPTSTSNEGCQTTPSPPSALFPFLLLTYWLHRRKTRPTRA